MAIINSPSFRSEPYSEEIDSGVEVLPATKLADQKFAKQEAEERPASARSCIAHAFARAFGRGTIPVGPPATSVLNEPLPHSFALRTSFLFTLGTGSARRARRLYNDSVVFVVGPAEIRLHAITITSGHPPPETTERRLLSLLYNRAKA